MIIAVDFDGTLSLGEWPNCGPPNMKVIDALQERQQKGDKIILWTCRVGDELDAAVAWCKIYGLTFDAVNANLPEILAAWEYRDTRKVFADEYWDDKASPYEENPTGRMTDRELRAAATGIMVYNYIIQNGCPPGPTDEGVVELRGSLNDAAMEMALHVCSSMNPDDTEVYFYSDDDDEDEDEDDD